MTADGSMPQRTNDRTLDAPAGWQLTTWLAELLSVPVGLVDAYLPIGRGVSARTREQLIVAVAEVNGNRYTAWVHGSWLDLLGPRDGRTHSMPTILLGIVLAVTAVISAETALGFVFDPRYRDFPYASLTMAVVPFMGLAFLNRPQSGARPVAEAVFAGLLAFAAFYVAINEGRDNWQSIWTCAMYLLFALTLWRARAGQSPR